MCELFAMSAKHPTTVNFSLETFAQRGGGTAHHKDGWGIGYYIDGDVQLIRESDAAAGSPTVRFVRDHNYQSTLVIGHIRKATQGINCLSNTQPFRREMGGKMHLFAHNGDLKGYQEVLHLGGRRPIGETDSEHAFCALLHALQPLWEQGLPSLTSRLEVIRTFAHTIGELGPANFLYADGDALFVHGHKRTQPDKSMQPPGLWHLCRSCSDDAGQLEKAGVVLSGTQRQEVHLVASVPLTDEAWIPMELGEVLVIREGKVVAI